MDIKQASVPSFKAEMTIGLNKGYSDEAWSLLELKTQLFAAQKKLKKCLSNNIEMIYVIDNEEYLENKYHFDIVEPFSGNVSYKTMHINHFGNHITHLVDISHFLGLEFMNNNNI